MLKEREAVVKKASILLDVIVLSLAFFLAYFLRQNFRLFYALDIFSSQRIVQDTTVALNEHLVVLFIVAPLWCGFLYINRMYESMRTQSLVRIGWIIIKSSFLMTLIFGSTVFLFKITFVSRLFFVMFVILGVSFLLLEKNLLYIILRQLRKNGFNYRTLLIVGTGPRAVKFIEKIKLHPEWGFKIGGAINDDPNRETKKVNSISVVGNLDDISECLHKYAVDEVIFVLPRSRLDFLQDAIEACEIEGIRATIAVDLFNLRIAHPIHTELDGIPLVRFETTVANEGQLFIKRSFDLIVSSLGILLLSPLFILTATVIKLSSKGPVFFKQERLGLNGKKFVLYKFRTMYAGAQKKLTAIEDVNNMNNSEFKNQKIQWITPVGRLLRKFSIDELPQMFNVFTGSMSLIGPRPTVPEEASQYRTWQRRRFSMKPGITCLWQIKGRNNLGHDEWMKLDLEYLDNWSLWLDFKILIKTIPIVLFGIGAY